MNKPYTHGKQPYVRDTHTRMQRGRCLEYNCTKIMHARYFRVFWVSSIQIGHYMCVVYEWICVVVVVVWIYNITIFVI